MMKLLDAGVSGVRPKPRQPGRGRSGVMLLLLEVLYVCRHPPLHLLLLLLVVLLVVLLTLLLVLVLLLVLPRRLPVAVVAAVAIDIGVVLPAAYRCRLGCVLREAHDMRARRPLAPTGTTRHASEDHSLASTTTGTATAAVSASGSGSCSGIT